MQRFDLRRLEEVIRTDATTTSQVDFLATHTPFKNLKYSANSLTGKGVKIKDEEKIFQEEIMRKRDTHQFIVVQGNNGTGKSHFIRWVKEKYLNQNNSDKEAILFIVRSQNTLKGALEQIINSEILPQGFKLKELQKLIEANQHLDGDTLKKAIVVQFALASNKAYRENNFEDLEQRYLKSAYDFLVDQTIGDHLSRKGGPIERIKDKLTPDEPKKKNHDIEPQFFPEDFEFNYDFLRKMEETSSTGAQRLADELFSSDKGTKVRGDFARFLNKNLEFVVQSVTSLRSSDLKHVFEELRKELKLLGKNLTIFIEDITSFTGIDRALVEVLVTEHVGNNSKFCRLFSIVGITNNYYNSSFPNNLKERVTGHIYLDNATLQHEDELSEMASRYINAMLVDKQVLIEWADNGARDSELPVASKVIGNEWALNVMPNGQSISMFPFNRHSLWNLFIHLDKVAQTPRRFLIDVISHTIKTYENFKGLGEFPPNRAEFKGEFEIPQWKVPQHERPVLNRGGNYGEQLITLLRIWGNGTAITRIENGKKSVGGLTKDIFDSFSLPFIDGVLEGPEIFVDNPPPDIIDLKNKVIPKELKVYENIKKELDSWVSGGKLSSYAQLRDDVSDLLIDIVDWEMEGIPGNIVSAFINNRRVSIEGQTGTTNEGFQVPRSKASQYALQAIAGWRHLGNKSWDYVEAVDDLANMHIWFIEIKALVIRSVQAPFEVDLKDWDLQSWGLLSEFICQVISGQFSSSKSSTEDIYSRIFRNVYDIAVEENRSEQWHAIQIRMKNSSTKIRANHDFIKRYFNRVQGTVTATTDVFFIDAYEVLTRLEKLRRLGWDIDKIIDPKLLLQERKESLWYLSIGIIDNVCTPIPYLIQSEKENSQLIIEELEVYLDSGIKEATVDEELKALFVGIEFFLKEVLPSANENFKQKDFENLLDGTLTARKMINALQLLKNAISSEQYHDTLMRYSAHPNGGLSPYIKLFQFALKLSADKSDRYEQFISQLDASNAGQSVTNVLQETKQILTELIDQL